METVYTDNAIFLSLNVSCWTGRAKLTASDLNVSTDELPPETLAALGSKKLIDPQRIQEILKIKTETVRKLNSYGVKLMGGWLISEDLFDTATQYLQNAADKFNLAVANLVNNYDSYLNEWTLQYPQWADKILDAAPTASSVASRFKFGFRAFKLRESRTDFSCDESKESFVDSAYVQLAADIKKICEDSFADDRASFKISCFKPVRALIDKLRNISFVDPNMGRLATFLERAVSSYEQAIKDTVMMDMFRTFMHGLCDPMQLQRIAGTAPENDSDDPVEFILAVTQSPEPQAEVSQSSEVSQPEPAQTCVAQQSCAQQPEPSPIPAQPEPVSEPVSSQDEAMQELFKNLGL